ncbi:hypothetical protein [Lysinibacillus pakistanensis]|uniref:hypothetical protein n=1 Tax=Lysinibacillus pakistanensis TaxID=759811 RepID=UPI0034E42021
MIAFKLWHVFYITLSYNSTVHINNIYLHSADLYCAKAQRQQQFFTVAKAKRQLQLRQGKIDL